MSFVDNPVISSLGNAIGLGPIFQAASQPPATTEMAAAAAPPKVGSSAPNQPEYRDRPYIPRNEMGPQGGGGGVKPGAGAPSLPGTMDPATLQSPQVRALLGQYGVQVPDTPPDPNLFIRNPAAFQKHPIISGLLERGLEGLAYAHPGQNFLDSLIGGVKGMQEANNARAQTANAQTMAPLNQAEQIQQLIGQANNANDAHAKTMSDIQYQHDMGQHYLNSDATRQERLLAAAPRYDKQGRPSYPEYDENGNIAYKPDQSWEPPPEQQIQESYYKSGLGELIQKYGSADKIPSKDWLNLYTGMQTAKGAATIQAATVRGADTVRAAGVRGDQSLSKADAARIRDIDGQSSTINKEIDELQHSSIPFFDSATGKTLITGSSKQAAILARQDKLKAFESQKQQLLGNNPTTNNQDSGAPRGIQILRDKSGRITGIK